MDVNIDLYIKSVHFVTLRNILTLVLIRDGDTWLLHWLNADQRVSRAVIVVMVDLKFILKASVSATAAAADASDDASEE